MIALLCFIVFLIGVAAGMFLMGVTVVDALERERDTFREESRQRLTALNELAASDMKIMDGLRKELEKDKNGCDLNTIRCQLSALRQKHSTMMHMVNDLACFANDFDESTNCGVVANGRPFVGED